jgi:hypothetical protein
MNIKQITPGTLVEPNLLARKMFKFPKDIVLPWKVLKILSGDEYAYGVVVAVERQSRRGKYYREKWSPNFLKLSVVQEKTEATQ